MRHLLGKEKSIWEKWLLIARFLDCLEHDFKEVYPLAPSPFPEGYEAALKKLFEEFISHSKHDGI